MRIVIVNMSSWENTIQPWYYVITNVLLSPEFQKRSLLFGLSLCRRAGLRSRGSLPPAGAELSWSHTPRFCSLALEDQIPFVSTLFTHPIHNVQALQIKLRIIMYGNKAKCLLNKLIQCFLLKIVFTATLYAKNWINISPKCRVHVFFLIKGNFIRQKA